MATQNLDIELVETLRSEFKKLKKSNATAGYFDDASADIKEWVSTGCIPLDIILSNKKNGGLPVGRLTEIAGAEGAGKTLLASYILANTQKMGGVAVFIDSERAGSREVLEEVGVDLKKLIYVEADSVEEVARSLQVIVDKVASQKDNPLLTIVWDSVAATATMPEIEGDVGDHTMGLKARLLGHALRKLIPVISTNRVCCVFINQLREKIGITFGDKSITPGGKAIPYHASIRLRLKHFQKLKDKAYTDRVIGKVVNCEVQKNKVAPPMRSLKFQIRWGDRPGAYIDNISSMFDIAESEDIFEKVTAQKFTFKYGGKDIEFTRKKFPELMEEPEFFNAIKEAIEDRLIITGQNVSDNIEKDEPDEEI